VETSKILAERSLEELLWQVLSARREGLVALRDRDGLRHGVWTHGGFVVGVHVAGRFDPLLDILRLEGALTPATYRACVEALWRSSSRSGAIAIEVAGVGRPLVRDALKTQATARMQALLAIAETRGHDAHFEPCDVPAAELSVRMPLGSLLRAAQSNPGENLQKQQSPSRDEARRKLRELALRLHPDRHAHLAPAAQKLLEREMAEATAAYHGFG
jgi:hypothetical protein